MDFGTLPPEINSARMYHGPGPGSMLAAAAAWDELAGQLYEAAADYHAMTSGLVDGWQGAAATAMGLAATPYLAWLNATAASAQHAARQARAAADAFQSAFAATVPPQLIMANRALRASLVTANFWGQNHPAIAAAEADYEKMWVQDAAAMYAYADASAAASAMQQFESPPAAGPAQTSDADDDVISAGAQVISTLPRTLRALSSASSTRFGKALLSMSSPLSKLSSRRLGFAKHASVPIAVAIAGAAKAVRTNRASVVAGVGRGMSIGVLSVPRAWFPAPPVGSFETEFQSAAIAIGRRLSGRPGRSAT
ncbi:hypothetical protein A9W99_01435 [Mycobacterium sp. 1164966.3]|uniref:PPE family protein n=1 Tax=Mycobacterium sp. 1164966.3 TaxID=1856861 RepID=UPI0007FBD678|nr:PPE family protein [Mycobacterium sp. 1164966.3]OBA84546.1 hypothetical protein A9W99_01435 [Mycobacterium sp. 1164966.3]